MKPFLGNALVAVTLLLSATACKDEEPGNHLNDDSVSSANFDIFPSVSYDEMVYVEGGTFLMGAQYSSASSPNYDTYADYEERPVHAVTLSSYYIGKYEVTQDLWRYVMNFSGYAADGTTMTAVEDGPWLGESPSSTYGLDDNYPAYNVSYEDIVDYFLPRLNQITGKNYRLPTDAEWEYAARGGQKETYTRTQGASGTYYKYSGSNTIGNVAWYTSNSSSKPHPVGSKAPNALGLYDMSGNVWEWCRDWYSSYSSTSVTDPTGPTTGSYRVFRGGSWVNEASACRVSFRGEVEPSYRSEALGFRLVLGVELPEIETIDPYDEMVYVEGGTFLMGEQSDDPSLPNYDYDAFLSPVHQVTLSSFYMGQYEVTQALWEYVMNYTGKVANGTTLTAVEGGPWLVHEPIDDLGLGDNYPAYWVSYEDIVNYFLPRLNQITGKNYRLPTEAEWEYAARGGQKDEYTRTQGASGTYYKYSGSNSIGSVAWYSSNSSNTTHPVGNKAPNALGLYDMSGNVWEWCSDWYDSSYYYNSPTTNPTGPTSGSNRVIRGGGWYHDAVYCRVSGRLSIAPSGCDFYLGFRLAHDVKE